MNEAALNNYLGNQLHIASLKPDVGERKIPAVSVFHVDKPGVCKVDF